MSVHTLVKSNCRGMDSSLTEYPVDGVLDLHVFRARDAHEVVQEYLRECRRRGILRVRIIHGKGRSVLRGMVHRLLDADPAVVEYHAAGDRSGWGATIVLLKPLGAAQGRRI